MASEPRAFPLTDQRKTGAAASSLSSFLKLKLCSDHTDSRKATTSNRVPSFFRTRNSVTGRIVMKEDRRRLDTKKYSLELLHRTYQSCDYIDYMQG